MDRSLHVQSCLDCQSGSLDVSGRFHSKEPCNRSCPSDFGPTGFSKDCSTSQVYSGISRHQDLSTNDRKERVCRDFFKSKLTSFWDLKRSKLGNNMDAV